MKKNLHKAISILLVFVMTLSLPSMSVLADEPEDFEVVVETEGAETESAEPSEAAETVEESNEIWQDADVSSFVLQAGGLFKQSEIPLLRAAAKNTAAADYSSLVSLLYNEAVSWDGVSESKRINVSTYNYASDDVEAAWTQFINENPDVFYVKTSYSLAVNSSTELVNAVIMQFDTAFTQADIDAFQGKVNKILSGVEEGWSEEQKALYLHDYLVTHCEYDLTYSRYTAYDTIVGGSSVCQGYTLAYKYLLNNCGVECNVISSNELNHAWNLVTINGTPYYVDCTYDDPTYSSTETWYQDYCRHVNFLRDREGITENNHVSTDWVDASGNDVYNGVTAGSEYENAWWSECISAIPHAGNLWAYVLGKQGSVYVHDYSANTDTHLFDLSSKWYVWGSTTQYISGLTHLASDGEYFYASTAKKIYRFLGTSSYEEYYALTADELSQGYIYGIHTEGNKLHYMLYTGYNAGAFAAEYSLTLKVVEYGLKIGGIPVTDENAADVFGDGTVLYNVETNTLTLNNAMITGINEPEGEYTEGMYTSSIEKSCIGLTIELIGESTIGSADQMAGCGILDLADGSTEDAYALKFTGDGSLKVYAEKYGIYEPFSNVKVNLGDTGMLAIEVNQKFEEDGSLEAAGIFTNCGVYASNGNLEAVGGIWTVYGVEVNGANVYATGDHVGIFVNVPQIRGISEYDCGIKLTSGSLKAEGGWEGIHCAYRGNISATGGTLYAKGHAEEGIVLDGGYLHIENADVEAYGKTDGILIGEYEGSVEVVSGTLTASGSYAGIDLRGQNSFININGGTVSASGEYSGIRCEQGTITVDGGTVTAEASAGSAEVQFDETGSKWYENGHAIYAGGSEDGQPGITLADTHVISTPVDYEWNDDTTCQYIQNTDGTNALKVVIEPGFRSPKFKVNSLALSGMIGVNFFMDLPNRPDVDYADSYMEFTVSGKTTTAAFDPDFQDEGGKGYYGFTCYVNSIQMAEPITAVFHYGDGQSVSKEYSVKEYITAFKENESNYDENTIFMVESLADYGHYIQPFLSKYNGWEIGRDYAEMDLHFSEAAVMDSNMQYVVSDAEPFKIIRDHTDPDIEKITYTLVFDSGTDILVYFKPAAEYSGEITFTLDGETVTAERKADGRYLIRIKGIPAHKLGDTHTILAASANGSATVKVSALSYVHSILTADAYQDDSDAKRAVASLLDYYYNAKYCIENA